MVLDSCISMFLQRRSRYVRSHAVAGVFLSFHFFFPCLLLIYSGTSPSSPAADSLPSFSDLKVHTVYLSSDIVPSWRSSPAPPASLSSQSQLRHILLQASIARSRRRESRLSLTSSSTEKNGRKGDKREHASKRTLASSDGGRKEVDTREKGGRLEASQSHRLGGQEEERRDPVDLASLADKKATIGKATPESIEDAKHHSKDEDGETEEVGREDTGSEKLKEKEKASQEDMSSESKTITGT